MSFKTKLVPFLCWGIFCHVSCYEEVPTKKNSSSPSCCGSSEENKQPVETLALAGETNGSSTETSTHGCCGHSMDQDDSSHTEEPAQETTSETVDPQSEETSSYTEEPLQQETPEIHSCPCESSNASSQSEEPSQEIHSEAAHLQGESAPCQSEEEESPGSQGARDCEDTLNLECCDTNPVYSEDHLSRLIFTESNFEGTKTFILKGQNKFTMTMLSRLSSEGSDLRKIDLREIQCFRGKKQELEAMMNDKHPGIEVQTDL